MKLQHELLPPQVAGRWVKRRKGKRYDPAQEELDEDVVDCNGIPAECDHVVDGRGQADSVFKPKVYAAQDNKYENVNHSTAQDQQRKENQIFQRPDYMEPGRTVDDRDQPDNNLLYGFQTETLEKDLEERVNGAEEHAVKFPFDDIGIAKVVQVQADNVEQSHRNQREAVDEQDLFEFPTLEARNTGKQNQHESIPSHRGKDAGKACDEEIDLVGQACLGILPEVVTEEHREIFHSTPPVLRAGASPPSNRPCPPKTMLRS